MTAGWKPPFEKGVFVVSDPTYSALTEPSERVDDYLIDSLPARAPGIAVGARVRDIDADRTAATLIILVYFLFQLKDRIMQAGIFSLSWDNIDSSLLKWQKEVFDALGYPVNQHRIDGFKHSEWMEWVIGYHKDIEIFIFIDADAIPLNCHAIEHAIDVAQSGRIFGCAQAANHLESNRDHIYAGPFYLAFRRETWARLGSPSLAPSHDRDVAQGLTLAAEKAGQHVELWFPTSVEEPRWPLGNSGQFFGIGTIYNESLYHLFESRGGSGVERFIEACKWVLAKHTPDKAQKYSPTSSPSAAALDIEPANGLDRKSQAKPEFTSDWFSHHTSTWTKLFDHLTGQPVHVLEIGSYEGRSSIWLCENVLTHPASRLTCVDLFSGDGTDEYDQNQRAIVYRRFASNIEPHSQRIRVLQGESGKLLRLEPAEETYDIVHVDGSHKSWCVLEDAVLAWRLLKTGGIMLFDDYMGGDIQSHHYPHIAIDAFLACHLHDAEIIMRDYQIAVRKIR